MKESKKKQDLQRRTSRIIAAKNAAETQNAKESQQKSGNTTIFSQRADVFFGLLICVNAVSIGVEIDLSDEPGVSEAFFVIEIIFLVAFHLEMFMRIRLEGFEFFKSWWGRFDAIVNFVSLLDVIMVQTIRLGSVIRIFRLLRIVRIIRLMRRFQELVIMVQTLSNSVRTVFWMMIFSLGLLYFGALICVVLIGPGGDEDEQYYFGSVAQSLFTHVMIASGEGWVPVASALEDRHGLWVFYVIVIVAFMNFAMQNVMRAIITYKVVSQARDEREMFLFLSIESNEFKEAMRFLFDSGDFEKPDTRTRAELKWIFEQEENGELLDLCRVSRRVPFDQVLSLFDASMTDEITFHDFVRGCLRLRALRTSWQVFLMHCDISFQLATIQRRLRQLVTCALSHPDRAKTLEGKEELPPAPPETPLDTKGQNQMASSVVDELLLRITRGETTPETVLRAAVGASFSTREGVSAGNRLAHALDCGLLSSEDAVQALTPALAETIGVHPTKRYAWCPRKKCAVDLS